MDIGLEIKERFSLVHVIGDIGEEDLERIGETIDRLMNKGYRNVVLDLTGVEYMHAKGVGTLVNHWERVRFKRGDLRIVGLNSRLVHLFKSMGVDSILQVYKNLAELIEKTNRQAAVV